MTRTATKLMIFLATFMVTTANAEVTFHNDGPAMDKGLPFSEAVRVDNLLFLAGRVGRGDDGALIEGGIAAETEQILLNIRSVLKRRGLEMSDVVKCTVFLADIREWAAFNEVYVRHFAAPYPARSAMGVAGLAINASVEVECIAAFE